MVILTWGLHIYSRQYLLEANLAFTEGRTMISYADAVEVQADGSMLLAIFSPYRVDYDENHSDQAENRDEN